MTSEDIQTNLRLPGALKERLRQAADASNRSMNAEVVARLEESFSAGNGASIDEHTLDLFAEKVGQVLDERERRRKPRGA